MSAKTRLSKAVAAIEARGVLLVYPVQNRAEPRALWHELHPRSPMRWAWDAEADPRVAEMWHLRESLARSRRVVYSKWLLGRATFFSLDLFRSMLAVLRDAGDLTADLSGESRTLLDLLHENSPMSTRALREEGNLAGRFLESAFTRAMRVLWDRLLVVGFGEVEAGGFPSLAVGATDVLFEDLWNEAADCTDNDRERVRQAERGSRSFARAWRRVTGGLHAPPALDVASF